MSTSGAVDSSLMRRVEKWDSCAAAARWWRPKCSVRVGSLPEHVDVSEAQVVLGTDASQDVNVGLMSNDGKVPCYKNHPDSKAPLGCEGMCLDHLVQWGSC